MPTQNHPHRRSARPKAQRVASRTVHLVAAVLIGVQVYAPEWLSDALRPSLQFLVIPAAVITGLFLWRQAQIRSFLTRHSHRKEI